jgi:deoxycytidine triphosphate deaminase
VNAAPVVGAVLTAAEIERLSNPAILPAGTEPLIRDLVKDNLKGAAYDLRMAEDGMVLPGGRVVRPGQPPQKASVLLEPGQTVLVSTLECLNIPNDLVGNMSIKGELASRGVLSLTGLIVDPGYKTGGSGDGRLHFRLANLGKRPLLLEPGKTKIASIQFVRLTAPTTRPPGRSFDDVWERVDEFQEGLGFLEDLRTLDERVTALDAEVSRQGRAVNLVVGAVLFVVATTLLGVLVTGLLTLGSSLDLVQSAKRVIPRSAENRILFLVGLFALAAIVFAAISGWGVRRGPVVLDSSGIAYARDEALRDLRMRRRRSLGIALTLLALLGVGAAALVSEAKVAWWLVTVVGLIVVAVVLMRLGNRIWWAIPAWRVDQRVRTWEHESIQRAAQAQHGANGVGA